MAVKKKSLNLSIPMSLLEEFEHVCSHYGHGKQKGMVLSAAILMFLQSDPAQQGACLQQVATAEITNGVERMIERAKQEQAERIQQREANISADESVLPQSLAYRPSKAAKSAGPSHHVLRKPPKDPQSQ